MKSKTPIKFNRGFSLIELISVIVLVGILSTYSVSRFVSRDGFSDYAAQDLIISAARIAQQRAMYDHSTGACYRLSISSNRIGAINAAGNYVGPANWSTGVLLDDVTVADMEVYFDGLGNALDSADCTGSPSATTIPITGSSGLQVCIYATGYVQSC